MSVLRTLFRLLGTDETTGVTIANNATATGSETDLFSDNAHEGNGQLFLKYTSTAAAGSIDIKIFWSTVPGQSYQDQAPLAFSIIPIIGTQKIPLPPGLKLGRYATAQAFNNGVGANVTNLTISLEASAEG